MNDVAVKKMGVNLGINLASGSGGDFRFLFASIAAPIEHGTREIGMLDAIFVGDQDVPNAEQGEIFDDLVAERASADDEHFGGGELFLVPPADQFKAIKPFIGRGRFEVDLEGWMWT